MAESRSLVTRHVTELAVTGDERVLSVSRNLARADAARERQQKLLSTAYTRSAAAAAESGSVATRATDRLGQAAQRTTTAADRQVAATRRLTAAESAMSRDISRAVSAQMSEQRALRSAERQLTSYSSAQQRAAMATKATAEATARSAAMQRRSTESVAAATAASTRRGARTGSAALGGAAAIAGSAGAFGLASLASNALNFEEKMSKVRAVAGATNVEFAQMNRLAIQLGAKTKFSASESADALGELSKAGFTARESMRALPGTMALAAASGQDLASSAQIQSDALRGFGLQAGTAGHVADVLAKSANQSAVDMSDLGESLKYISPVARASGQSLETISGALEILGNAGIRGSQAGTTMRAVIARLVKPTRGATEALDEFGIKAKDLYGPKGLKPLPEIIGKINKGAEGMPKADKLRNLVAIFGREPLSGVTRLVDEGQQSWERYADGLTHADGVAAKTAKTMQSNVKAQVEQVTGALESGAILILQRYEPQIRKFASSTSDAIGNFTKDPHKIDAVAESIGNAGEVIGHTAQATVPLLRAGAGVVKLFTSLPDGAQRAILTFGLLTVASRKLAGSSAVQAVTGQLERLRTRLRGTATDARAAAEEMQTAARTPVAGPRQAAASVGSPRVDMLGDAARRQGVEAQRASSTALRELVGARRENAAAESTVAAATNRVAAAQARVNAAVAEEFAARQRVAAIRTGAPGTSPLAMPGARADVSRLAGQSGEARAALDAERATLARARSEQTVAAANVQQAAAAREAAVVTQRASTSTAAQAASGGLGTAAGVAGGGIRGRLGNLRQQYGLSRALGGGRAGSLLSVLGANVTRGGALRGAGIAALGGVAGAALSGGSVLQGAAAGGAAGLTFGPLGAAVGAFAGGATTALVNAFKGASKKRAEAAAKAYAGRVTQSTERVLANGLGGDPGKRLGAANAKLEAAARIRSLYGQAQRLDQAGASAGPLGQLRATTLRKQADQLGKAAGLDPKAVFAGTSRAARKAGADAARAFSDGLKSGGRAVTSSALLRQFDSQLKNLDRPARQAAARAMVAFAQQAERSGNAPKGTVDRLIRDLGKRYDGLAPVAGGAARKTSAAFTRGLRSEAAVKQANETAGEVADQFRNSLDNLPKIAVRSLPGAVAVLRTQMDRLRTAARKNDPSTVLGQQARQALPQLERQYKTSLTQMAQDLGLSKSQARDWAASVSRAARRAGDGSAQVDSLKSSVANLNQRMGEGKSKADSLLGSLTSLASQTLNSALDELGVPKRKRRRRGGRIGFRSGGGVPIMASGGEEYLDANMVRAYDEQYPGLLGHIERMQRPHFASGGTVRRRMNLGGMVIPGPSDRDATPMHADPGAFILTGHGRQLRDAAMGYAKGGWVRTGATIDKYQPGNPSRAKQAAYGGMSFAELLVAGANAGMRPDLTQLLGFARTQYGMRMGSALRVRRAGSSGPGYEVKKSDNGSGQPGNKHFTIDLHDQIAKRIGFGGRGDVEVARLGTPAGRGRRADGSTPGYSYTKVTDDVSGLTARQARRRMPVLRTPSVDVSGVFDQARQGTYDAVARADILSQAIAASRADINREKVTVSGRAASTRDAKSSRNSPGTTPRVAKMVSFLSSAVRKWPKYLYGGGHGSSLSGPFDCSGLVYAGLRSVGLASGSGTTDTLKSYGASGMGKQITIGVRGSSGRNAHTMIEAAGRYFEAGGGGQGGSVGERSGWDGFFPIKRHPRGYRRGGTVRIAAGALARAPSSARQAIRRRGVAALDPRSRHFVGWGYAAGGYVPPLPGRRGGNARIGTGARAAADTARALGTRGGRRALRDLFGSGVRANADATDALGALQDALSNARRATARRLTELAEQLDRAIRRTVAKRSPGGRDITRGEEILIRRARAARSVVDAALLGRSGTTARRADKLGTAAEQARTRFDLAQRRAGVDTGSSAGLAAEGSQLALEQAAQQARRAQLTKALSLAKRAGRSGREAAKGLTDELRDLDNTIADTAVRRVEAAREQIKAAAQERVDTTQFGVDLANGANAASDAMRSLARTADTPDGLRQQGQEILARSVPALQAQQKALLDQAEALRKVGDIGGFRQATIAAQQAGADITNAMAQAADLFRQAVLTGAQNVVDQASSRSSLAQIAFQRLGLEQQLAGTDTAGGADRASFITSTIIPALQNELAALQQQAAAADQAGDDALRRQDAEAIAQKTNDILQAQLDAQNEIKATVAKRTFGGSLALQYQDTVYTDSILDAVGA